MMQDLATARSAAAAAEANTEKVKAEKAALERELASQRDAAANKGGAWGCGRGREAVGGPAWLRRLGMWQGAGAGCVCGCGAEVGWFDLLLCCRACDLGASDAGLAGELENVWCSDHPKMPCTFHSGQTTKTAPLVP